MVADGRVDGSVGSAARRDADQVAADAAILGVYGRDALLSPGVVEFLNDGRGGTRRCRHSAAGAIRRTGRARRRAAAQRGCLLQRRVRVHTECDLFDDLKTTW